MMKTFGNLNTLNMFCCEKDVNEEEDVTTAETQMIYV